MPHWKVLSSKRILESEYMNVVDQKLLMRNGKIAEHYYLIEKKDVAIVFALTRHHKLILVNEYKHGAGGYLLQLPIGFMEKDEKPEHAALRELEEETGYKAKSAKLIGKYISSPSDMTNKLYLFFVKAAEPTGKRHLDDTEEINVKLMDFGDVVKAVETGRIKVMPHMAAILLMKEYLKRSSADL